MVLIEEVSLFGALLLVPIYRLIVRNRAGFVNDEIGQGYWWGTQRESSDRDGVRAPPFERACSYQDWDIVVGFKLLEHSVPGAGKPMKVDHDLLFPSSGKSRQDMMGGNLGFQDQ